MKKRILIIRIICIFLIIAILYLVEFKKINNYMPYNGVMLAMSLTDSDGITTNITEIPLGTNYTINIECENADGRWDSESWNFYVENITGIVKCNLNFATRTDDDKLNVIIQTENSVYNNGYRYSGNQPNNYLMFNNELWRIIGLVPACTSASSGTCNTRTNLVKIIREESIGGISYNYDSSSVWEESTLYTLLNNYYYGKKNITGSSPCYSGTYYDGSSTTAILGVCDYRVIGISSNSDDYYGKMVESVYWDIGVSGTSSSVTSDDMYELETTSIISSPAKVGILSPSDYGYASGQNSVSINDLINYVNENWMYKGYDEWAIIHINENYSQPWMILSNGIPTFPDGDSYSYSVRPVVYLNSEIYVISGTGTILDPYIIGW